MALKTVSMSSCGHCPGPSQKAPLHKSKYFNVHFASERKRTLIIPKNKMPSLKKLPSDARKELEDLIHGVENVYTDLCKGYNNFEKKYIEEGKKGHFYYQFKQAPHPVNNCLFCPGHSKDVL